MLDWIWCVHFCDNIYLSKFCRKLYWFWFSAFRNSWMKIFSKDFGTFTGVYVAIDMGPCHRSYILLVQKFRTSEMLDKWSPTSKVSVIKLSHYPHGQYNFWLVREPTCPLYLLPCVLIHCVKSSYSELFWSAFPAFGLNTERYGVLSSQKFLVEQGESILEPPREFERGTPGLGTDHTVFQGKMQFLQH